MLLRMPSTSAKSLMREKDAAGRGAITMASAGMRRRNLINEEVMAVPRDFAAGALASSVPRLWPERSCDYNVLARDGFRCASHPARFARGFAHSRQEARRLWPIL